MVFRNALFLKAYDNSLLIMPSSCYSPQRPSIEERAIRRQATAFCACPPHTAARSPRCLVLPMYAIHDYTARCAGVIRRWQP
jgi:hypothetical protein